MRKLYRSQKDRMISGVLGGIGKYFNIDSTIVRLIFVALLFISFFTVSLVYIAAVFIIPNEGEGPY